MASTGDWDALFAEAADIQPTNAASTGNEEISTLKRQWNDNEKERKKKKGKRKSQRVEDDAPHRRMLLSRIDPPPKPNAPWNSWMGLQNSFSSSQSCAQWKQSSSSKSKCDNCGKSALHHRLTLSCEESYSKQQAWPLVVFCQTRNIRCCAKIVAKSASNPKSLLDAMRSESSLLHSMTGTSCNHLPREEANLLEAKLTEVTRLVDVLEENGRERKKKKEKFPSNFEDAVRLIIACDSLYHRIYYLQLIKLAPILSMDVEDVFIPHPQFYFGLECLCLESRHESLRWQSELVQNAKEMEAFSPELKILLKHLIQPSGYSKFDHPLSAIYRFRFDETISLFHETGWVSLSSTKELVKQSLTQSFDEETRHETPAPRLLTEWRDSCRDFFCNLFAYATISNEVVTRICDSFSELERELKLAKGIIEIGAGTGYVAKLLRDAGILVDAWDIQPTNAESKSMNEYHGHTPPFYSVSRASTFPRSSARDVALLLCYPPPESPMAFETFMAYRRAGGKCLIHIGEFKGLTGDKRFEDALSQTMVCKARYSCLGWGTDASSVTFWVESDGSTTEHKQLLLPCSNCKCGKGAIRRCRLLRSIVYCSESCCNQHSTIRSRLLRLFMIDDDGDSFLDFNNSNHFATL
jgi:ribosomal protein L32